MNDHDYLPILMTACGLILLLTLESWLPAAGNHHHRLRHAARNMTLWLLDVLALALLAAQSIANVAGWAEESRFGLLNLLSLPPAIATVTAILLFDGWLYLLHRANNKLGFLWRFHRVHHSRVRVEIDSNYSIIFSFWDRIGGTFRLRKDGRPVDFGLDEYDDEEWQRVKGLLSTRFRSPIPNSVEGFDWRGVGEFTGCCT